MQPEPLYNSVDTGYSPDLPLESLILSLKKNGFSIKPDDYIEILKVIERFQPATLEEAGDLICPLIVTNDQEQSRFYVVFKKLCEVEKPPQQQPVDRWKKILQATKKVLSKKIIKIVSIITALLLAGLLIVKLIPAKEKTEIRANIAMSGRPSGVECLVGDSVWLSIGWEKITSDSIKKKIPDYPYDKSKIKLRWDLGNGKETLNTEKVLLIPDSQGVKKVFLFLEAGDKLLSKDSIVFAVCNKWVDDLDFDPLPITTLSIDSVLYLNVKSSYYDFSRVATEWYVNGELAQKNSDHLHRKFDKPGSYDVSFFVHPFPDNRACGPGRSITVTITDSNEKKFRLQTEQVGDVIEAPKKIKTWLQNLVLYLFLISLVASLILHWIKKRRRKKGKKNTGYRLCPPH